MRHYIWRLALYLILSSGHYTESVQLMWVFQSARCPMPHLWQETPPAEKGPTLEVKIKGKKVKETREKDKSCKEHIPWNILNFVMNKLDSEAHSLKN